ncbi:hypothetical protein JX266_001916 [Neoarthrinium moseri]|nr:hypothetical protein JX266_001916 [Neoarthrinium moseri]
MTSEPSSPDDHGTSLDRGYETGDDYYNPPEFWLPRIRVLCQVLWPSAAYEETAIAFIADGENNKVFALTIAEPEDQHVGRREYVLRLPELEHDVLQAVGVSRYLRRQLLSGSEDSLALVSKIPQVVRWDHTRNNALQYPYIIANRMPGINLETCWDRLGWGQRVSVAREISHVYSQLRSLRSPVAGKIQVSCAAESIEEPVERPEKLVEVKPFGETGCQGVSCVNGFSNIEDTTLHHPSHARAESSSGKVVIATVRRRFEALYHGSSDASTRSTVASSYERLLAVVEDMHGRGDFDDEDGIYCLSHLNIQPNNILIDIGDGSQPRITGILGWGAPVFGPSFLAAEPPEWLWSEARSAERAPENRHIAPQIRGQVQGSDMLTGNSRIRRAFEDVVGSGWVRQAYSPESAIARRILILCTADKWGAGQWHEVEDIFRAWEGTFERKH